MANNCLPRLASPAPLAFPDELAALELLEEDEVELDELDELPVFPDELAELDELAPAVVPDEPGMTPAVFPDELDAVEPPAPPDEPDELELDPATSPAVGTPGSFSPSAAPQPDSKTTGTSQPATLKPNFI